LMSIVVRMPLAACAVLIGYFASFFFSHNLNNRKLHPGHCLGSGVRGSHSCSHFGHRIMSIDLVNVTSAALIDWLGSAIFGSSIVSVAEWIVYQLMSYCQLTVSGGHP